MRKEMIEAYSSAILEYAIEIDNVSLFLDNSKFVKSVLDSSQQLSKIIRNKSLSNNDRNQIVEDLFKKNVEPEFFKGILVMSQNNDLSFLEDTLDEVISKFNNDLNIMEGTVYSVRELSELQMNRLTSSLNKKIGKKIKLTNKIDKSIIGGIKVEFPDLSVDGSIKNKLKELDIKLKGRK